MSQAPPLGELQGLSDQELVDRHDALAKNVVVGISYYLEELRGRRMERLTAVMTKLTWAIALMTFANVVLFAISLR